MMAGLLALLALYLVGYARVFLAVFVRFEAVEPSASNSLSAALISLLWPVWLPGFGVWWALRGRKIAATVDAKADSGVAA